MIKDLLLDFDGVVLESVDCKTEAFAKLYASYGQEVQKEVIQHHSMNGGMSRFEKIKLYHDKFVGIHLTESEVNEWANKFAELVLQQVLKSEFVPGSMDFFKKYSKQINLWVITATPQKEIEFICKELNIASYFKGIFGSPENKTHWINVLKSRFAISSETSYFIGDSPNDLTAAEATEIPFILRVSEQNVSFFNEFKGQRINDFLNFNPLNLGKSFV